MSLSLLIPPRSIVFHTATGIHPAPSARPFSKGLLKSYAIPCFCFSACSLRRIRVQQRSLGCARDDEARKCLRAVIGMTAPVNGASSRHSILRLRRAPSPRGYSDHMQYRAFVSLPAHYVAYECKKDPSATPLARPAFKGLLSWRVIP